MRYYKNTSTGELADETTVNGCMLQPGSPWELFIKLPRYDIETPPYALGRMELNEYGDYCKFEELQNRLCECIDELGKVDENSVSDIALESITTVLEDLKLIANA